MKNTPPSTANLQVSEMEPRLENAWGHENEPDYPSCLDTNTCAKQL